MTTLPFLNDRSEDAGWVRRWQIKERAGKERFIFFFLGGGAEVYKQLRPGGWALWMAHVLAQQGQNKTSVGKYPRRWDTKTMISVF